MAFHKEKPLPYSEYCHLGVTSQNFALNLREIVTNNEDVVKLLPTKEEIMAETKNIELGPEMNRQESKLLKNVTCTLLECSMHVDGIQKAIRERTELKEQLEDAEVELKMQIADLAPVQFEYDLRMAEKKKLEDKFALLRYKETVELYNKKTELTEELTALSILAKERAAELKRMEREQFGQTNEESHINFRNNTQVKKKHTGTYLFQHDADGGQVGHRTWSCCLGTDTGDRAGCADEEHSIASKSALGNLSNFMINDTELQLPSFQERERENLSTPKGGPPNTLSPTSHYSHSHSNNRNSTPPSMVSVSAPSSSPFASPFASPVREQVPGQAINSNTKKDSALKKQTDSIDRNWKPGKPLLDTHSYSSAFQSSSPLYRRHQDLHHHHQQQHSRSHSSSALNQRLIGNRPHDSPSARLSSTAGGTEQGQSINQHQQQQVSRHKRPMSAPSIRTIRTTNNNNNNNSNNNSSSNSNNVTYNDPSQSRRLPLRVYGVIEGLRHNNHKARAPGCVWVEASRTSFSATKNRPGNRSMMERDLFAGSKISKAGISKVRSTDLSH